MKFLRLSERYNDGPDEYLKRYEKRIASEVDIGVVLEKKNGCNAAADADDIRRLLIENSQQNIFFFVESY